MKELILTILVVGREGGGRGNVYKVTVRVTDVFQSNFLSLTGGG